MGFVSALQIVFVTLKLVGVIDWSWWLVLLPFEIGAALMSMLLLGLGLTVLFTGNREGRKP